LIILYINNSILEKLESCKDLGVTFDPKLSFLPHIVNITSKAKKMLGLIMRNCKDFRNPISFITLYCAFVRSGLEYADLIWSPLYIYHKQLIESIQRKFMKYVAYKLDGTYPERGIDNNILLHRFSLMSLENRRTLHTVVFVYKLIRSLIDCSHLLFQLNFAVPQFNSRQRPYFYLPTARSNVLANSPIHSVCDCFNRYSNIVDLNVDSLNIFKRLIRQKLTNQ
jgi:hypothetical protein